MKRILAQFPLQLVVFPGESLNLHIFEPRYRELIHDCEHDGITFGVPTFHQNRLLEIGAEVRLIEVVERYPSGELDVRTEGIGIFRILNFQRQLGAKSYAGATVETLDYDTHEDPLLNARILELTTELFGLMKIDKPLADTPAGFDTYQVGHLVGFDLDQEYTFLTLREALPRQQYLLTHLEQVLPVVREMENMRRRAQLNGHFKNLIPPNF